MSIQINQEQSLSPNTFIESVLTFLGNRNAESDLRDPSKVSQRRMRFKPLHQRIAYFLKLHDGIELPPILARYINQLKTILGTQCIYNSMSAI